MGPIDLDISALLLDLENPRIVGAKNRRDALQKVVEDQGDKLLVLARSIIEEEGMNPMDRLLVLKEGREYIVLEGNRRLAALKILATPSVLEDISVSTPMRKSFSALAKSFDAKTIEPLACFEIASRSDATKWIQQRHTGQNGGKGVVDWSGLAASRFRGQSPTLQALAFVAAHGGLSEDEKKAIEDGFPVTTLERLVDSRDVRSRLGFDVKNGKLLSGLPPEELLKPLRRLVLDLAARRVNVSQLKNKKQQAEYIDSVDKVDLPDLARIGSLRPIEEIGAGEFKEPAPPRPQKKAKRKGSTSARRTLIPKGFALKITHRRIALIFEELCRLKVDEAPNAISVLFRVFLELSVDHYMDKRSMPLRVTIKGHEKDKNLRSKVAEVVEQLVKVGKNQKDYKSVERALSNANSPLSMDLLNDYVHNRFTTPRTPDLLASWDDAQHLFESLWA